jgi:hypothetical protein
MVAGEPCIEGCKIIIGEADCGGETGARAYDDESRFFNGGFDDFIFFGYGSIKTFIQIVLPDL